MLHTRHGRSPCLLLKRLQTCRSLALACAGSRLEKKPIQAALVSRLPQKSGLPAYRIPLQVALYLHVGEADVIVPSDAELLAEAAEGAGSGSTAANSTAWLGCIIANHSLMAGTVVEVVDGVEDAQECCALCRQTIGGACNAWNWCQQAGGCRCGLCCARQTSADGCCAATVVQQAGCQCACAPAWEHGMSVHSLMAVHAPLTAYSCSYTGDTGEVSLQQFQCECSSCFEIAVSADLPGYVQAAWCTSRCAISHSPRGA